MLQPMSPNHKALQKEERAIIHTLNVSGEDVTVSKFYGTTEGLSASSIQLRTRKKFQPGENVEVILHLQGHRRSFNLSGVIGAISDTREQSGYLVTVELNRKSGGDMDQWRRIFH